MPSTNTDRQVFCFFFMTAARGPLFLHKYQSFSHSASFALIQFFFCKAIFTAKPFSFLLKRKWEYTILIGKSFWKVFGAIMYMKFVWCYPSVLLRTPVFLNLCANANFKPGLYCMLCTYSTIYVRRSMYISLLFYRGLMHFLQSLQQMGLLPTKVYNAWRVRVQKSIMMFSKELSLG